MKTHLLIRKKLLFVLFLLLSCIGAKAETYDATIESGKTYRIITASSSYPGSLYDDVSGNVPKRDERYGNDVTKYLWTITDKGNGAYTVKNMATGRYLQVPAKDQAATMSDTEIAVYIKKNTFVVSNNYFNITATADSDISLNVHGANGSIIAWEANDAKGMLSASEWGFMAVDMDNLPVPPTYCTIDDIINDYNGLMVFRSAKPVYDLKVIAPRAGDNNMELVQYSYNLKENDKTDWSQIWVVSKHGTAAPYTYSFRNLKTGKYIQQSPSLGMEIGKYYIKESTLTENAYNFASSDVFDNSTKNCIHIQDNGNVIVHWCAASEGKNSDWYITPVPNISKEAVEEQILSVSGVAASMVPGVYRIENYNLGRDLYETSDNQLRGQSDVTNLKNYWCIEDAGEGKFSLRNLVTGNYIMPNTEGASSVYTLGSTKGSYTIERLKENYPYDGIYTITDGNGKYNAINCNKGSSKILKWETSDDASHWRFHISTLTDNEIADAQKAYEDDLFLKENLATLSEFYLSFFTDGTATQLKDTYQDMSDAELRTAMSSLPASLQDVAVKIKNNSWTAWEKSFRIAEYSAFSNADYWAGQLKTRAWGVINNPTGIVADTNEKVYFFVGSEVPAGATLKAEARTYYNIGNTPDQSIDLKQGLNFITCEGNASHIYIRYESANGTDIADWTKLNIHVEGGRVNGYFDIKKHSDEDWMAMRNAGLFHAEQIDLLGSYAQLRVQTTAATQNGDKISPLVGIFDWFVESTLDITGVIAVPDSMKNVPGSTEAYTGLYPAKVNNRLLCIGSPGGGNPYASSYHICLHGDGYYKYDDMKERCGYSIDTPTHEYGHVNQGAIDMAACMEISNLFFCNVLLYRGSTGTSQGWNLEYLQRLLSGSERSWPKIVMNGFNGGGQEHFFGGNMYFQLYLYYHAAGNDPLFYQKLFKQLRENPMQYPQGNCTGDKDYLHFAKTACDAAQEDLSDFFDAWGFFVPVENYYMECYGDWYMTTTQEMIDEAKAYMSKYPKANGSIMFIDDRAVVSYREDGVTPKTAYSENYTVENCVTDLPGAQYSAFNAAAPQPSGYSYTNDNGLITIASGATGAAGFKLYDAQGELLYLASSNEFVIPENLRSKVASISVAATNGRVYPMYETNAEGVFLQRILGGDGKISSRYTKGNDQAELSRALDGPNAIALLYSADGNTAVNIPATLSQKANVGIDGHFCHLDITDMADYNGQDDNYTADKITYSRSNTAGYNSVCLPFKLKLSDLPAGSKIEVVKGRIVEDEIETICLDNTTTEVEAGTPCFVWCPEECTEWNITINENRAFVGQPTEDFVSGDENLTVKGSFAGKDIGADKYKLSADGSTFGKTTIAGKVSPFRVWLEAPYSLAQKLYIQRDDLSTNIDVSVDTPVADHVLYDLQGRRVSSMQKGVVYILNGKKITFK